MTNENSVDPAIAALNSGQYLTERGPPQPEVVICAPCRIVEVPRLLWWHYVPTIAALPDSTPIDPEKRGRKLGTLSLSVAQSQPAAPLPPLPAGFNQCPPELDSTTFSRILNH